MPSVPYDVDGERSHISSLIVTASVSQNSNTGGYAMFGSYLLGGIVLWREVPILYLMGCGL